MNATEKFFGPDLKGAGLILDDRLGGLGGRKVALFGDGSMEIVITDLSGNDERYIGGITVEDAAKILDVTIELDLAAFVDGRRIDMDRPGTLLTMLNAKGKTAQLVYYADQPDSDFLTPVIEAMFGYFERAQPDAVTQAKSDSSEGAYERIARPIRDFLERRGGIGNGAPFREERERRVINFMVQAKSGEPYSCKAFLLAKPRAAAAVFYAYASNCVRPEIRHEAAEFVARANYCMMIGNFELDMRDGEVRYKVGVDLLDIALTAAMIDRAIGTAVAMIDRYVSHLNDVCAGRKTAAEAVAAAES